MGRSRGFERLPQIIERLKRARNFKLCPQIEANSLSFRLPGFKYDDFDRGGFVNIVKINRMMETNRTIEMKELGFKSMENLTFFMFGGHLQVSKTLYRNASLDFPMKFQMVLSGVGKSSIDAAALFVKEETDTVLAQRIYRIVHIDQDTKTTLPLPEEVRKDLQKVIGKSPDYLRLPRFDVPASIPERCFVRESVVRFADLDFLFHANQGSYLLYVFECAAHAVAKGFYSKIHTDICFYPAKTASGIHVAEAFAGDVLSVVTWEDDSNPMLIYFVIRCKDKDVYYAKVEFYNEQDFNGDGD